MPTIAYFRQQRVDGGIRSGIDCDGFTVLEHFEPGDPEDNPTLIWFVDVFFEGNELPSDAVEARQWLLNLSPKLLPSLLKLADELEIGIDNLTPLQRKLPSPAKGVTANILVNSIRRESAKKIGDRIREIGQDWSKLLARLEPLVPI